MSAYNSMWGDGMTKDELIALNNAISSLKEAARKCKERIANNGGRADKLLSFQLRIVHAALHQQARTRDTRLTRCGKNPRDHTRGGFV